MDGAFVILALLVIFVCISWTGQTSGEKHGSGQTCPLCKGTGTVRSERGSGSGLDI